ncbi:MAG: hypothetical protein EOO81_04105 [Oxalobacteraceae bacterium]|nr:MAG: hypothetical protein EOO81_04105 [Oxalobacteraceae bacterium]
MKTATLGGILMIAGGCSEEMKAKEAVRLLLSDPASAEFIDVATNEKATCGSVNARNRLGGYVGYQPFIYADEEARIGYDVTFIKRFNQLCPYESGTTFRAKVWENMRVSGEELRRLLDMEPQ